MSSRCEIDLINRSFNSSLRIDDNKRSSSSCGCSPTAIVFLQPPIKVGRVTCITFTVLQTLKNIHRVHLTLPYHSCPPQAGVVPRQQNFQFRISCCEVIKIERCSAVHILFNSQLPIRNPKLAKKDPVAWWEFVATGQVHRGSSDKQNACKLLARCPFPL